MRYISSVFFSEINYDILVSIATDVHYNICLIHLTIVVNSVQVMQLHLTNRTLYSLYILGLSDYCVDILLAFFRLCC